LIGPVINKAFLGLTREVSFITEAFTKQTLASGGDQISIFNFALFDAHGHDYQSAIENYQKDNREEATGTPKDQRSKVDWKVLVNYKIETWPQVMIKTIANLLAFIQFISHNEKTFFNDKDEQPFFCEMLESLLTLMNTTRVLNWAESTTKQAPHSIPYTFLLTVHNLFATFCDMALDSSAQARARKGTTTLEPADLPLMTDIFVMFTELQIALTAASKNNTLAVVRRS
jgi:hypothetical protein